MGPGAYLSPDETTDFDVILGCVPVGFSRVTPHSHLPYPSCPHVSYRFPTLPERYIDVCYWPSDVDALVHRIWLFLSVRCIHYPPFDFSYRGRRIELIHLRYNHRILVLTAVRLGRSSPSDVNAWVRRMYQIVAVRCCPRWTLD